ncbi:VOC family protein [Photobacterium sp. 1_MG-2023]|uniref:VOC family protein n=1 Tax=Photobacterium sp. 1_MG-2023 TaxID=3062646 RepID=UPI0026E14408|nr:VOC family protein [Photobacterium sp. 1_MG-2023]MDO6708625.1 VOC family protein [Photobacterium sp. 1_MG-2023]
MISNILLGTNNIHRSEAFYDTLLALFGARKTMKTDRSILWQTENDSVGIAVCLPYDSQAATSGNGNMVGLKANSEAMVREVYQTALSLGGTCEGEPGERKPGVFAAYFRDPEQHKFGVFYIQNSHSDSQTWSS